MVRASIVCKRRVLDDQNAVDAAWRDLTRQLRERATARGRYVSSNPLFTVETGPQPPTTWWRAMLGKTPPRLSMIVATAKTEPLDDPL